MDSKDLDGYRMMSYAGIIKDMMQADIVRRCCMILEGKN